MLVEKEFVLPIPTWFNTFNQEHSVNLSVLSEFSWLPLLTRPDNRRKQKLAKISETLTRIQASNTRATMDKGFNVVLLYIPAHKSQLEFYPKIDH